MDDFIFSNEVTKDTKCSLNSQTKCFQSRSPYFRFQLSLNAGCYTRHSAQKKMKSIFLFKCLGMMTISYSVLLNGG